MPPATPPRREANPRCGAPRCWYSVCTANGWACRPGRWTRWPPRVLPLPHRRDPAVLGVTNVRGTLTVCLSLARLLGLEAAGPEPRERAGAARMLIFGGAGRAVVPVDEVEGIHSVDLERLEPLPATVAGASLKILARGGALRRPQRGRLDETLLMQALERSLA